MSGTVRLRQAAQEPGVRHHSEALQDRRTALCSRQTTSKAQPSAENNCKVDGAFVLQRYSSTDKAMSRRWLLHVLEVCFSN